VVPTAAAGAVVPAAGAAAAAAVPAAFPAADNLTTAAAPLVAVPEQLPVPGVRLTIQQQESPAAAADAKSICDIQAPEQPAADLVTNAAATGVLPASGAAEQEEDINRLKAEADAAEADKSRIQKEEQRLKDAREKLRRDREDRKQNKKIEAAARAAPALAPAAAPALAPAAALRTTLKKTTGPAAAGPDKDDGGGSAGQKKTHALKPAAAARGPAASAEVEEDDYEDEVVPARKHMLACLENMMQVNEEAKNAMDVANDKYFAALNELFEAESKKAEACIHFQYQKHICSLETEAGGHEDDVDVDDEARLQKQFDRSHAEYHGKNKKRGNPATMAQGGGGGAAEGGAAPPLKRRENPT
jgi:hypothetical protein